MGLSMLRLREKRVLVHGSDVDLFVLLLAHYQNIDCSEIYMKSLSGYACITAVLCSYWMRHKWQIKWKDKGLLDQEVSVRAQ